jgi:hypothetical protein
LRNSSDYDDLNALPLSPAGDGATASCDLLQPLIAIIAATTVESAKYSTSFIKRGTFPLVVHCGVISQPLLLV